MCQGNNDRLSSRFCIRCTKPGYQMELKYIEIRPMEFPILVLEFSCTRDTGFLRECRPQSFKNFFLLFKRISTSCRVVYLNINLNIGVFIVES